MPCYFALPVVFSCLIDLLQDVEKVAQDYLGFSVHVGWPHMTQAKVVTVSSNNLR